MKAIYFVYLAAVTLAVVFLWHHTQEVPYACTPQFDNYQRLLSVPSNPTNENNRYIAIEYAATLQACKGIDIKIPKPNPAIYDLSQKPEIQAAAKEKLQKENSPKKSTSSS